MGNFIMGLNLLPVLLVLYFVNPKSDNLYLGKSLPLWSTS